MYVRINDKRVNLDNIVYYEPFISRNYAEIKFFTIQGDFRMEFLDRETAEVVLEYLDELVLKKDDEIDV